MSQSPTEYDTPLETSSPPETPDQSTVTDFPPCMFGELSDIDHTKEFLLMLAARQTPTKEN